MGLQSQAYLDTLYHFDVPRSEFFNCIIESDEIVALGLSYVSGNTGLNFVRFNLEGEVIDLKYIEEDSTQIFLNLSRQLKQVDNKLYSVGSYLNDSFREYLFSVNSDFTEYKKYEILFAADTSVILPSFFVEEQHDGQLYILSAIRDSSDEFSNLVSVFDTERNEFMNDFHILYNNELTMFATEMLTNSNQNKILLGSAGNQFEVEYYEEKYNNFIAKLDDKNELEKTIIFFDKGRKNIYDAIIDDDDNVYYLTEEFGIERIPHPVFPGEYLVRDSIKPSVIKLDSSFNIIWETDLLIDWHNDYQANLNSIIQGNNTDELIIAGVELVYDSIFFDREIQAGLLAKININGELIWKKRFLGFNQGGYFTQLSDVVASPDGGYVAVGMSAFTGSQQNPNPNWLQSYLVKVNEEGGFDQDTVSISNNSVFEDLKIYPNPLKSILFIDQGKYVNIKYELFDLNGRLLKTFHGSFRNTIYSFDLSFLPSGPYMVRISDNNHREDWHLINKN